MNATSKVANSRTNSTVSIPDGNDDNTTQSPNNIPIESSNNSFMNQSTSSTLSTSIVNALPSIPNSFRRLSISSSLSSFTSNASISKIIKNPDAEPSLKERTNLVSLLKLVVKDLITSFTQLDQQISEFTDDSSIHLINYFVLTEKILKHGLKQSFISAKSTALWIALENLPKFLKESTLISESVRSLSNTKTSDGRIRAWIRLAMMHKKLAEFIFELVDRREELKLATIYHDHALMMSQEMSFISGLMVGVNVIDYNFDKNLNFDTLNDVIDLSCYLRTASCLDEPSTPIQQSSEESNSIVSWNCKHIFDQKVYLEELNKRLEANIDGLKKKIVNLESQNIRLEIEDKLNQTRIQILQGNSSCNQSQRSIESNSNITNNNLSLTGSAITNAFKSIISSKPLSNNQKVVKKPNKPPSESCDDFEIVSHENIEVSSKETDQDISSQTDSLSIKNEQLQETKSNQFGNQVNSENKCSIRKDSTANQQSTHDKNYKQDSALLIRLQEQEKELFALKERAAILESSYRDSLAKIKSLERDLDSQLSQENDKATTIRIYEKDIRDKQELVDSLKASLKDAKSTNSELNQRLSDANAKLKDRLKSIQLLQNNMDKWKLEHKTLVMRIADKEKALKMISNELADVSGEKVELANKNEELKKQLDGARAGGQIVTSTIDSQAFKIKELESQLKLARKDLSDMNNLRDQNATLSKKCKDLETSLEEIGTQLLEARLEVENLRENSAMFLDSQWKDSSQVKSCDLCQQLFSVTRRKHHCRLCGNVFCQTCSDNKMELASSSKPVRVCDTCHSLLLAKFVKSAT